MAGEEILIADDEAAMRLAIRKALQREVLRVTEALELLRRGKFALVILDVMMPDASGYDVIQSMRGRGNHTPIMVLSGKSDEVDQALGLGFGADYYLTKPFHVTVLIQAAKALIRRSRAYNQSEPPKLCLGSF